MYYSLQHYFDIKIPSQKLSKSQTRAFLYTCRFNSYGKPCRPNYIGVQTLYILIQKICCDFSLTCLFTTTDMSKFDDGRWQGFWKICLIDSYACSMSRTRTEKSYGIRLLMRIILKRKEREVSLWDIWNIKRAKSGRFYVKKLLSERRKLTLVLLNKLRCHAHF